MGDLKDFLLHDETSLDLLYRIHKLNARTGLKRLDRFINNGKGLFPGECVTVTGAHGSGKSSLLRAIAVNAVLPYVVPSVLAVVWTLHQRLRKCNQFLFCFLILFCSFFFFFFCAVTAAAFLVAASSPLCFSTIAGRGVLNSSEKN